MRLLLITIQLILASAAIAQTATIKGKISDDKGALAKATITLLKASDSSSVKIAVANENGMYEFENIEAGAYLVFTSNVGYKSAFSAPFTVAKGETKQLETIKMEAATIVNTGAVVTAKKKPLIEVKADKMIFNVESSINATGSNAFELLRKSPGVVIDKDDNLMLKGKNGVRIFLDGKPTPFDGKDLAAFLKNINSADIDVIELITNPSARYEAEGNAGIINIKLKKNKKLGYNGSLNTGFAMQIHPKTNNSLSLNYKDAKWNLFSNYSNSFGKNQANINFYRVQLDSIFDQRSVMINDDQNHNFKIGADYTASKTSTFGFIVTGAFNRGGFNSTSKTPITNKNTGVLGSVLTASNTQEMKRDNLNLNLNYRYTDTTGLEVGVDIDKGKFKNFGNSYQPNEYRYQNNLLNPVYKIYRNLTPTDIDINSAKIDVAMPVGKAKLEIGGKYAKVTTDNTSNFFNVINNVDYKDLNLSNQFAYTENINALYTNFNKQLNQKLTLQVGVRMENTQSEGVLTSFNPQPDDIVKRNYTNLFPSGALSYMASMNHMWNLTYSKRIDRPGYQDLNPFEYKIDELTFQKGNAFLRPQYSNVYELTHTFKYRYNTTLSYTRTTDFSSQIIDYDGYRSFVTQRNLASQDVYSINFSAPVQVNKWWSLFGNINGNYTKYNAKFPDGKVINTGITSGSIFGQNTFTLKKGFSAEISGFYTLPTIWGGTFESIGMGGIDFGLQAPLFNNNANIRFGLTDVFRTMRFKGVSTFANSYFDANGRWESQQFKVNLNWRFGNKNIKTGSNKKLGSEEEQKRANKKSGGIGG
jgi:iron complex outermembrane recepter protein